MEDNMKIARLILGIGAGILIIPLGLSLNKKRKLLKAKLQKKPENNNFKTFEVNRETQVKRTITPNTHKINEKNLGKLSFYKVECIGGHVGQKRGIILELPIFAQNGREAAKIARYTPRIKHDAKNAILNVTKISYSEFIELKRKNKKNPYFHCTNRQMQREFEEDLDIIDIEEEEQLYTKKHSLRKTYNYREPEIERLHGNISSLDLA